MIAVYMAKKGFEWAESCRRAADPAKAENGRPGEWYEQKTKKEKKKRKPRKYAWLALMLSVLCVLACVGIAAVYFLLRPAGTERSGRRLRKSLSRQYRSQNPQRRNCGRRKPGRF